MNRKTIFKIIIIVAIIAALVVGVQMMKGRKATLPSVPAGDGD